MHAMCSQTQNNTYTKMTLSTVKWSQWDKTQPRELLGLFICVCSSLCTIVAHNTAQNRPDNFPSCPPDNHHCSNNVYLREGGNQNAKNQYLSTSTKYLWIKGTELSQRVPPIFGWAAFMLSIGPHSIYYLSCDCYFKVIADTQKFIGNASNIQTHQWLSRKTCCPLNIPINYWYPCTVTLTLILNANPTNPNWPMKN